MRSSQFPWLKYNYQTKNFCSSTWKKSRSFHTASGAWSDDVEILKHPRNNAMEHDCLLCQTFERKIVPPSSHPSNGSHS